MKTSNFKRICSISIFSFFTLFAFAEITYKVGKGDTLYSISRKYQITVAELRAANNLSESDVLKAGQKLIIPDADIGNAVALSSSTKNDSSNATAAEIKTQSYVVKKGDTLYRIAKDNNLTVAELLAINNLDNNEVIKVGQKLKVPQKNQSGSVGGNLSELKKSGETVIKIAENAPDTRTYGSTLSADSSTKWPVSSPKITQIKGKISGVSLSAGADEKVTCIHEGTVMYVGIYRGFGQVVFVQSKTGLIYAYTGLGSVKVRKGEYAVSGSELGTAGIDSISGNSQIQFMVFQNGQPIDPGKAPRN